MKGMNKDTDSNQISAQEPIFAPNETLRSMLHRDAHDKAINADGTSNPFAHNVIVLLEAGYTERQIINQLMDIGGELFLKFNRSIQVIEPK